MLLNILSISIISSIIACYSYKKIWNVVNKNTPTGYGVTLVFFLIIYTYFINFSMLHLAIYLLIAVISLIYWIDDYSYLSSFFRFFLQFLSGVLIYIFLSVYFEYEINTYSILFAFISGILNIFLSNVINFYDGLDLNVATFLIILGFISFFMLKNQDLINKHALIIVGFTLGFIFFNFTPNNIFFGDSGCFVVSSCLTFIIIKSILIAEISVIYLIIPLALPSFDVVYVVLLRIYKKEPLLTRNYYHLYHQFRLRYKNMLYILPQVLNAFILYIVSKIVINEYAGNLMQYFIFIFLSIILTALIYIFFKNITQIKK